MPIDNYEPLFQYLRKFGECDRTTAIQILNYKQNNNGYRALDRLVKQKRLKFAIRDGRAWYSLYYHVKDIPKKVEAERLNLSIESLAALYRLSIMYGRDYFSSQQRANLMHVLKLIMRHYEPIIPFIMLLQDLVNTSPSKAQYSDTVLLLDKRGWLTTYDPADQLELALSIDIPNRVRKILGITEESWEAMLDPANRTTLKYEADEKAEQ